MSLGPCIVDPAFHICVRETLATPGFVENFDRLWGFRPTTIPIEKLIDEATGATSARVRAFAEFVRDYVYGLLPEDVLQSLREQAARELAP